MRFSKLELKGFKSFANPTSIHFNEQVTGIVGPNGSGKSNIVDAIRWVLGEQKSAELRLDKNSNVIFNGSKSKKAASFASVSLVFENNANILPVEYSEVSITRELYQDGESVYKMNNTTCRLKDIISLFTDTGVGSNTYAIIGFGMVEDLLNNKDHHRRSMIEQTAGITKFKARKRETINKLNSTIDDLDQVQNLLAEIESNMAIFRKQAKRAERFNKIKDEYKSISTNIYHNNKRNTRNKLEELQKKLTDAIHQFEQLDHEISEKENRLEIDKNNHLFEETKMSDLQKELNKILDHQKSFESKRDMTSQRISFIHNQSDLAHKEINHAKEKIADLELLLKTQQDLLPPLEATFQDLQSDKARLTQDRQDQTDRIAAIDADIIPYLQDYDRSRSRIVELEKLIAQDQGRIASFISNQERDGQKILTLEAEYATISDRIKELEKERDVAAAKLDEQQKKLTSQSDHLLKLKADLSSTVKERDAIKLKVNTISHEAKTLKSLITNLEGFPEATKFIHNNFEEGRSYPVLAEILNVPDEIRGILENFLGSNLSSYVVNTYQEGVQFIHLLGSSLKGRSGFYVLEGFQQTLQTPALEGLKPVIEIIECDPIYKPLIASIFHQVYLVPTIDKRLIEQLKSHPDIICLAIDGSAYGYKGFLSGGSKGLIEGQLLGRQKKLNRLESELAASRDQESALELEVIRIEAEISNLEKNIVATSTLPFENQLRNAEKFYVEVKLKMDNIESILQTTRNDTEEYQRQLKQLSENVLTNQKELEIVNLSGQEVEKKLTEHKSLQSEASDKLKHTDALIQELNMGLLKNDHETTVIRKDIQHTEQQINQFKNTLSSSDQIIHNAIHEVASLTSVLEEAEEQIIQAAKSLNAMKDQFGETENQYFQQRNAIAAAEELLRKLNRNRNDANILANEIKSKHQSITFDLQRIDENFQLEFGDLPESNDESVTITEQIADEELKNQQLRLRTSIQQFGEVNPLALQAYEEIKVRHDEITAQREDILLSKAALLATIEEIETTSKEKYIHTFEQVRNNFKNVFRELFTADDDCDLIIDDANNPLDSDITIIAKPKGKKPQSLSQLSGGEKTLTGIAFLFALYLIKPAPFCILDEIDAPLDDANVEKLNNLIRAFSNTSQFIIITHNKATMAAMDVLYGVYMETQGISGLSKVDFREFEHNMLLDIVEN